MHETRRRGRFAARRSRPPNILLVVTDQERHGALLPPELRLPNRERITARATSFSYYGNCLRDVDRSLGLVLDETDAWRDTVVVFTSDHGEMSGAHGMRGKGNVIYRENCALPFAVCHPDVAAPAETAALASHIDIAPTLLGFAGLRPRSGRSSSPDLRGNDLGCALEPSAERGPYGAGRDGVVYQWDSRIFRLPDHPNALPRNNTGATRDAMRGCFDGRWKFARYFTPSEHHTPPSLEVLHALNDCELYDTLADPLERDDRANRSENQNVLWRMARLANALVAREIGNDDAWTIRNAAR